MLQERALVKDIENLINRQNTLESFVHSKLNTKGKKDSEVTKKLLMERHEEDDGVGPQEQTYIDESKPFQQNSPKKSGRPLTLEERNENSGRENNLEFGTADEDNEVEQSAFLTNQKIGLAEGGSFH